MHNIISWWPAIWRCGPAFLQEPPKPLLNIIIIMALRPGPTLDNCAPRLIPLKECSIGEDLRKSINAWLHAGKHQYTSYDTIANAYMSDLVLYFGVNSTLGSEAMSSGAMYSALPALILMVVASR